MITRKRSQICWAVLRRPFRRSLFSRAVICGRGRRGNVRLQRLDNWKPSWLEAKQVSLQQPLTVASFLLKHYLRDGRLRGRGDGSRNHYGVGRATGDLPGIGGLGGAVLVYGGHGRGLQGRAARDCMRIVKSKLTIERFACLSGSTGALTRRPFILTLDAGPARHRWRSTFRRPF